MPTGPPLEAVAVQQMANACAPPVAVAGVLMPDAHPGYGLPIGGVLATAGCVIPYAVGVDIACRMRLTVYDRKANMIAGQQDRLANIIESETRFGMGCEFKQRRQHEVMDEDWSVSPITLRHRDKAWAQLNTSGSGNHSRIAMDRRFDLPHELKHLAWLTLDEKAGQEYWAAMNLMGRYAAANHALIHKHIAKKVGARVMLDIENHHNFAWKETYVVNGESRDVIVHRKRGTPAGVSPALRAPRTHILPAST